MTDNRTLDELVAQSGVNAREGLDSYHFDFASTGVPEIDLILGAICWAGKAYHGTEMWTEEGWNGEPSEIENIQKAAAVAAEAIATLRQKNEALREAVSFALKEIDTAFNVNVRIEIGKRLRASLGE